MGKEKINDQQKIKKITHFMNSIGKQIGAILKNKWEEWKEWENKRFTELNKKITKDTRIVQNIKAKDFDGGEAQKVALIEGLKGHQENISKIVSNANREAKLAWPKENDNQTPLETMGLNGSHNDKE